MRGTLTHKATIEAYQETGTELDDGAGGTVPEKDWVAIVDGEPCRYEPAGQGYVREDQGARVYESPRVIFPAQAVGHMTSVGEYELVIDEGDDYRLTLPSIPGEHALVNIDVHYRGPQHPSHVTIEVENTSTGD